MKHLINIGPTTYEQVRMMCDVLNVNETLNDKRLKHYCYVQEVTIATNIGFAIVVLYSTV